MTKINYTLRMKRHVEHINVWSKLAIVLGALVCLFPTYDAVGANQVATFVTSPQATNTLTKQRSTTITIISPAHEATLRNTQGQVHISWQAHTKPGVIYEIYLDGTLRNSLSHTAMTITNVDRGRHSIYLQVKDKSGKVIAVSPTHTIYMHQHSKLFK